MMETIIFDIETAPLDRDKILAEATPFDPESVKLGNVKDLTLRMAKTNEALNKHYSDILDRAALHATTGRVLVAGFYYPDKEEFSIIEGDDEFSILSEFWTHCKYSTRHIGFNCLNFDLPFVTRRSWHLGVAVPSWVFDGRYFSRYFIDLMQHWGLGVRADMISLDRLAKFVGLKGKSHDGKDFAKLYATDHDEAIEYVKTDLRLTADIARRLQI